MFLVEQKQVTLSFRYLSFTPGVTSPLGFPSRVSSKDPLDSSEESRLMHFHVLTQATRGTSLIINTGGGELQAVFGER